MAKKRGGEEGGGDSWLNTYADMVTLLLTFFAVLLSMSSTDEAKFNAFIESFSVLPKEVLEEVIRSGDQKEADQNEEGEPYVSGLNELYLSIKEYVETHNQTAAVDVSTNGQDVVKVKFNSLLFFQPDEYTLLPSSEPTLSFVGDALKSNESKIRSINVCGHTADIEGTGGYSDKSEWFLSSERAATVVRYFDENKGIDPIKLISLGYGGKWPIEDNMTEEGREKNRRVELIIVGVDSTTDFSTADPLGVLKTEVDLTGGMPPEGTLQAEAGKTDAPAQEPPQPADAATSGAGTDTGATQPAPSP